MTDGRRSELLRRWQAGEITVGAWHRLATEQAATIVGSSGYDWVCVDAQHGFFDYSHVVTMVKAVAAAGTPAIVRVPWHDPAYIMKALDAGASGILVPIVSTVSQVELAVASCRYPPDGYRSWAGLGVGNSSPAASNAAVACGVMLETRGAWDNLEQILSVPGVDFCFVGPDDFSVAHGFPPLLDPEDELILERFSGMLAACRSRGIPVGIYCSGVASAVKWAAQGFQILCLGSDVAMLSETLATRAETAKQAIAEKTRGVVGAPS
jgi:4-hydroxy-2-oxoheptanedioate aldolase